ncbi:hypothetical protein HMPREF9136_0716 [Prevotella dentalis DSM 3688]|uniref:Uncharacterized protein n=1 Tax=Prevotella dentalis (strain ATCC 49559 / DSM 3688 / JCM 13448 / NCTC 12043 / ES 2772) TaxID=908937 RepID=F9D1I8_PREDD|nr:hypothetical protein HMPREF9136_0716 [Prevotella dentalis DSM 3688]
MNSRFWKKAVICDFEPIANDDARTLKYANFKGGKMGLTHGKTVELKQKKHPLRMLLPEKIMR